MYLNPVRRDQLPEDPSSLVGLVLTANPPTTRRPITGRVVEVDGYSVVLETFDMFIAVDIEDCELPGAPPQLRSA